MLSEWYSVQIVSNAGTQPRAVSRAEITFIIVSYNSAKTLAASIEACVHAAEIGNFAQAYVVIYDNCSFDASPEIIRHYAKLYPQTVVGILGSENVGFGRANNRAVELFPSHTYALINPDVSFAPETIGHLQRLLQTTPNAAIVCPKLLYADLTVQPSVRRFPTFTYFALRNLLGERFQQQLYPFHYYYDELYEGTDEPCEVDWGIGAFMLVSGQFIEHCGLFDERYFLYFEDVQLCWNAWRNGYRVLFDPQTTAIHGYQRASTSARFNYLRLVHMISGCKFFWRHPKLLFRPQTFGWTGEALRPAAPSGKRRVRSRE